MGKWPQKTTFMTMLWDSQQIKTDSHCVIFIAPRTNYCDHICGSHTPWGQDPYRCKTTVWHLSSKVHLFTLINTPHLATVISQCLGEPWSINVTDKTHNLQKTHCSLLIRNSRQKPVSSVRFFQQCGRQKAFCRRVRSEMLLISYFYYIFYDTFPKII